MIDAGSQKGVTLIELIVVMVILVAIMAMALPSFMSYRVNAQYKEAARTVAGLMRDARSRAISENRSYQVIFDVAARKAKLTLESTPATSVIEYVYPSGLGMKTGYLDGGGNLVAGTANTTISFLPNGSGEASLDGGGNRLQTVCVTQTDGTIRYRINLASLITGRVNITR